MKKRYFCDIILSTPDAKTSRKIQIAILLSVVIIGVISYIIAYSLIFQNHKQELNFYPEKYYSELEECVKNAVHDGKGIDVSVIPKEISYSISNEKEEIIFESMYNLGKELEYVENPKITVELSNDFEIISQENNKKTKKEYQKRTQLSMKAVSMGYAALVITLYCSVSMIGLFCLVVFSAMIKRRKLRELD